MTKTVKTRYASIDDAPQIAGLLDKYRVFYGQEPAPTESLEFVKERFYLGESVVIVASEDDQIIGFTQLFPSFSSVTLQRLWILNDLYVEESKRHLGVGKLLLEAAKGLAKQTNAKELFIEGADNNPRARKIYTSFGFIENKDYHYYHLPVTSQKD